MSVDVHEEERVAQAKLRRVRAAQRARQKAVAANRRHQLADAIRITKRIYSGCSCSLYADMKPRAAGGVRQWLYRSLRLPTAGSRAQDGGDMSPYSRWQDAMYAQMRLLSFYDTSKGIGYLRGVFEDMNDRHSAYGRRDWRMLAGIHIKQLVEAEPIWVSEESCQLVEHARETFEPEPCLATDPFVPCGFALLAEPFIIHDAPITEKHPGRTPGGRVPVRAISWMPVHDEDVQEGCFWISLYVHVDDELALGDTRWGDRSDEVRRMLPLSMAHQFQWTWGEAPPTTPDELSVVDEDPEAAVRRGREQVTMLQAFWRIGSQFTTAQATAHRQLRRERARKKLKHTDDVTIIQLRRFRPAREHEPTDRELTVRHLVRGYWARRHTLQGPRQVWVRPHVKGGDHLPFKDTKRAWEFTR